MAEPIWLVLFLVAYVISLTGSFILMKKARTWSSKSREFLENNPYFLDWHENGDGLPYDMSVRDKESEE